MRSKTSNHFWHTQTANAPMNPIKPPQKRRNYDCINPSNVGRAQSPKRELFSTDQITYSCIPIQPPNLLPWRNGSGVQRLAVLVVVNNSQALGVEGHGSESSDCIGIVAAKSSQVLQHTIPDRKSTRLNSSH